MALDEGTTSTRAVIYDKNGNIISSAQKEFSQIYPKTGWVEQDPMEIWAKQLGVAQEALYKIDGTYKNLVGIGITNQRETTVVWDKNTGEPVYNAIVWQCRRTANFCDELREKGAEDEFHKKTGLILDPYFSATKLVWILENVEGAREKALNGELLFGTVDTWLIWKFTSGRLHITDYSNASRTMMFNINTLDWDEEILKILNIPVSMLPKVMPSSCIYGYTEEHIFGGAVALGGIAGDQQSSLFGQGCFEKGQGKMTYGTGGFMLLNTGEKPVFSKNGLITTVAWGLDGEISYALEGSVFIAGAAVQWLRDEMEIIETAGESEIMARAVDNSNNIIVIPAFTGLGAPYWDPYARGIIIGITRGVNKNHIVRATLESLAFQTVDLASAMEKDFGDKLSLFKVDGGAAENDFLMEVQANFLGQKVIRPRYLETTSLGAAYLAGLATGYWEDKDKLTEKKNNNTEFNPYITKEQREAALNLWHKAMDRSRQWSCLY